jgi:hypothetical protein
VSLEVQRPQSLGLGVEREGGRVAAIEQHP